MQCAVACARRGVLVFANIGLFTQAGYRWENEESIEKLEKNAISSRRGHFEGKRTFAFIRPKPLI